MVKHFNFKRILKVKNGGPKEGKWFIIEILEVIDKEQVGCHQTLKNWAFTLVNGREAKNGAIYWAHSRHGVVIIYLMLHLQIILVNATKIPLVNLGYMGPIASSNTRVLKKCFLKEPLEERASSSIKWSWSSWRKWNMQTEYFH